MCLLAPNSYIEALIVNVAEFADGAVQKVIKIKWGHKGGAPIH